MKTLSLIAAIGAAWAGVAVPPAAGQSSAAPSVLAGVFNEAQAIRGQTLYYQHCINCHGETMEGVDQAPPLAGPKFGSNWNGVPLAAIVERMTTMPPDKPGALSRQENVDLLTYILWYNGLPLGNAPLGADQDVLAGMTFETPPPGQ